MHTNVFCITPECGVVPAEMSIARMSLRQCVEKVYRAFIEPVLVPKRRTEQTVPNMPMLLTIFLLTWSSRMATIKR